MSDKIKISPAWVITLLSVIAGGYLSWQWFVNQGDVITISFEDASGLVPGQSGIFYKGAKVGKVTNISLAKDEQIVVAVRMEKNATVFLREGTQFWIARPEVGFEGIRNLSTIASGSTIKMRVGEGSPVSQFVGLEDSPLDKDLIDGLEITLEIEKLGSISVGSPITYRDLKTGEITSVQLSEDGSSVVLSAKIYEKYVKLIQKETVFWNSGEVQADFKIFGTSKVSMPSLSSLVSGEVSFANSKESKLAEAGQVYQILLSDPSL